MTRLVNKRASFNFRLEPQKLEAGVAFLGWEAKAVREGRADLTTASVRLIKNQAVLLNAKLFAPNVPGVQVERERKLLLHRSQILSLSTLLAQKKLTLIPLAFYTKGRLIKLELGLGKPKRKFEKREVLKKRDLQARLRQDPGDL